MRSIVKDVREAAATRDDLVQNAQMNEVARKLNRSMHDFKIQGMVNFILGMFFGVWPLLQGLSAYFLPVRLRCFSFYSYSIMNNMI